MYSSVSHCHTSSGLTNCLICQIFSRWLIGNLSASDSLVAQNLSRISWDHCWTCMQGNKRMFASTAVIRSGVQYARKYASPPLIFTHSNLQPVSRWVTAKQLRWAGNIIEYIRDFDLVSFFSTICVLRSSSPDCPPHPLLITPIVSIKGRTDGWINQSEELVSVTFLLRPISTPFGPSGSSPACQAAWWHQAWPSELQERATAPGKSCDIALLASGIIPSSSTIPAWHPSLMEPKPFGHIWYFREKTTHGNVTICNPYNLAT